MGFLPAYFTRKSFRLPSFKQLCRENPQTHQLHLPWLVLYSLAAAYLCVSPLNTRCFSERAAQTPSPEGWGSEFIQVCLGFEEDIYRHWALRSAAHTRVPHTGSRREGRPCPHLAGPGPASPTPSQLPLTRAAGIAVCSAISTSHLAPAPRARGLPEDGCIPPGSATGAPGSCYSFALCSSGWESQLLETGFLGIFLCPLWTLSALPKGTPTSRVVVWGFRWLIFRIMLGAVSTTFSC